MLSKIHNSVKLNDDFALKGASNIFHVKRQEEDDEEEEEEEQKRTGRSHSSSLLSLSQSHITLMSGVLHHNMLQAFVSLKGFSFWVMPVTRTSECWFSSQYFIKSLHAWLTGILLMEASWRSWVTCPCITWIWLKSLSPGVDMMNSLSLLSYSSSSTDIWNGRHLYRWLLLYCCWMVRVSGEVNIKLLRAALDHTQVFSSFFCFGKTFWSPMQDTRFSKLKKQICRHW